MARLCPQVLTEATGTSVPAYTQREILDPLQVCRRAHLASARSFASPAQAHRAHRRARSWPSRLALASASALSSTATLSCRGAVPVRHVLVGQRRPSWVVRSSRQLVSVSVSERGRGRGRARFLFPPWARNRNTVPCIRRKSPATRGLALAAAGAQCRHAARMTGRPVTVRARVTLAVHARDSSPVDTDWWGSMPQTCAFSYRVLKLQNSEIPT